LLELELVLMLFNIRHDVVVLFGHIRREWRLGDGLCRFRIPGL
jgi:hypothetical protein